MPLIVSKTSNCHYGRENTKNMSFKCQIFPKRLTFNGVCSKYNCDVSIIIIILGVLSAILPIIKCAKLENPQIRLLINDDELLQEKSNIHEAAVAGSSPDAPNSSGEHFNLYRSELKRLSYETIHRILRDENEPSYRREDTELRYYQKRSPSYEETHQLIKRSAASSLNGNEVIIDLHQKNLTVLFISPALLKQLKVASVLDLSDNFLSQFNATSLHNVTSLNLLNLKNNSFTFIPLTEATTLRSLNLNHNLIKTSNLTSNIYLRNLYLSYNRVEQLSSIDFSLLKNLESLDISHNHLSNPEASFFTQRMHNLKHLNLAFNRLSSIYRETFYNLLSLNTLLLLHNNITDIDYETFLALPNLQYLDLSFNGLKGKSIRALQGITGLVALNIAFNPDIGPYMQEFVASWSLKELDASGTGLCQIPAALAQSVRSLKLTHNWLKIINCGDLDSYPLLQYLDLSFSHIEHIEDDALGRLEILEILMLDHNLLRKIPVSLPVSLEHLFLQHNDIMEITQQALQGLINLKTLDLSHNKLLYLPDIPLPKLQTLNLQSSQIRGISQGIIHSLPRLNDLMLEDNPIKCTDLLGIAEWASTCRLRVDKEEEDNTEQDNFVIKVQDLKNKYERMHNFYEQFDSMNTTHAWISKDLKAPKCAKESLNSQAKKEMVENLLENTKTMTTAMPLAAKMLQVAAVRYTASTKSSSNKTDEVVEPVSKRSKEVEQQLENVQQQRKSTMKTFQTTNKIKKWIKQETKTTSLARRAENKTTDVIATATTFVASIKATTTPVTTTTDSPNSTAAVAAVDFSTTTLVSQPRAAFNSSQQGERQIEGTIDKLLAINLPTKIQQPVPEPDIKTKIASAAKEIKSLATILNPKSMQTKITNKPIAKQAYPTTTISAAIPTEIAGNLDTQPLLAATAINAGEEEKQDFNATRQTTAAFLNTTHKIQTQTTTTTPLATAAYTTTRATITKEAATAATVLSDIYKDKLKDLQSNYNSNDNKNGQINAKILNKTNKTITSTLPMATATIAAEAPMETITIDSGIITTTTSNTINSHRNNNENHTNAKIFDNLEIMAAATTTAAATTELQKFIETTSPATITATSTINSLENEQHLLQTTMEKKIDVNVKCTKQINNTNECNEQQQHQNEDKAGRMPTMVATTLEKTTALETSTEIPKMAATAAASLTPVTAIHRHEPLQLLVKDRHLIGTPLLMHKGDNLMVTADELILPTNNISKGNNNSNNSISHNGVQDVDDNRQHDLEESHTTVVADKTNKSYLETSQITTTTTTTTAATMATPTFLRTTLTTATNIREQHQDSKQQPADPIELAKDFGKSRKFSGELKTKKPSLIMKKMTIITKQHEQQHDIHNGLLQGAIEPLENEVHAKQIDSSHYRELKPISLDHTLKHSTVNTPINSNSKRQASNLLQEPQTFQHEHELLLQQILQEQQAEGHQKITKTEQWSDLRKAEHKENHPGLILLVSSGLFVVLLLGLMHVYRCDVPWRRHSPSHHLRPHQRPNSSFEDDSHSFLSYSEGMQKWHHSTRLEAPYNSPLHNLHVRELQKTSACEKPATVKSSATNFKPSLNRAILLNNTRSLSQSSTTTTSTASASSSAVLDDESFYIEMTPDSGQMAQALQSELLPMELLNMKQLPTTVDYHDTIADSQTSLEDDNTKRYQQQQLQQVRLQLESSQAQQFPSLASSAATSATGSAATNVLSCSTTSMSVRAQSQSRKFGLW